MKDHRLSSSQQECKNGFSHSSVVWKGEFSTAAGSLPSGGSGRRLCPSRLLGSCGRHAGHSWLATVSLPSLPPSLNGLLPFVSLHIALL